MIVDGSFPLNICNTPIPIAIPTGVITAKMNPKIMAFFHEIGWDFSGNVADEAGEFDSRRDPLVVLPIAAAIRVPRAIPSNIWWNIITAKRVMKAGSGATTMVRPITTRKLAIISNYEARSPTDGMKNNPCFQDEQICGRRASRR